MVIEEATAHLILHFFFNFRGCIAERSEYNGNLVKEFIFKTKETLEIALNGCDPGKES